MLRFIAIFSPNPSRTLAVVRTLTPRFVVFPPDGFLLEETTKTERKTLQQLFRQTDAANQLKIGVASTRIAALFAAKSSPGMKIPPGREGDFLAPLSVNLLSLTPQGNDCQLLRTLFQWGIRTLGELAALPQPELITRLGQIGPRLQDMARGQDIETFQCYREGPHFEETQELEWTLDSLEPLSFILGGILERLCTRLQSYGLATESLRVHLKLNNRALYKRTLRLAFPMRDPKVLLSLLLLDLQSQPPDYGIVGVSLRAAPVRPQVIQYSLLRPAVPNPEKLARTLGRLTALVGKDNIGSPVVLDTHRPDAVKVEPLRMGTERCKVQRSNPTLCSSPRLCLRRLRPPIRIQFQRDQILDCAGPWRSSGDWWEEKGSSRPWVRDEWDVELVDGSIYRIYRDFYRDTWFLEGVYD